MLTAYAWSVRYTRVGLLRGRVSQETKTHPLTQRNLTVETRLVKQYLCLSYLGIRW